MASILCLAHYCDTHGPTPLMVTEGFAVACPSCHDEDDRRSESRPGTSHQSKKPEGSQDSQKPFSRAKSSSSDKENDTRKSTQPNTPRLDFSSSALETPPESPRLAALSIARGSHRRDSSFRKTYDENDRKRAIPCENCALTIPSKVKSQIPDGAPGSPMKSGKGDNGSPVLRTRKAYERISKRFTNVGDTASIRSTPSDSNSTSNSDDEGPRRTLKRTATTSSISSFASSNSQVHTHYLEYTSTHDPLSSTSFSILRASCLRTLSCETLPPAASPTTPTSPASYGPYKSFQYPTSPSGPSATTASGGPIFFGDPLAGYTTAFIFRVPDPYARGRRRVYAFIHLSSSRERAAMRAFAFLAAQFRELASWVVGLAEMEADRLEALSSSSTHGHGSGSDTSTTTPASSLNKNHSAAARMPAQRKNSDDISGSASLASSERKLPFTPTSAFLSGRPYDPDGYPRKGLMGGIRSRGLAELVGQPEFFIELHRKFVRLLAELGGRVGGEM